MKIFILFLFQFVGCIIISLGQGTILSGTVIDSETGNPLPYATIGVKGTTMGTASNQEGLFVLEVPINYTDSILFISYVGYHTYHITVGRTKPGSTISLNPYELLLDEVEIIPWTAWQYVQNAINKVPENYLSDPFMTTSYYNESIAENDAYLKYTEGIIETYNPAYGDTARIASRLLQARKREDLSKIEFMRSRLEKRLTKERKKAVKKGEDNRMPESLDDAVLSATFGGPRMILRNDPIRDTASFLNPDLKRYYNYEISGYTTYNEEKVIIIHFESRRKYEYRKRNGEIYISLDSDAIVSIEFESRIIIPDLARPVMYLYGLGATDPVLTAVIHYRPYKGKWYMNDMTISGGSELTDKNFFKKNTHSTFELFQALITTSIDLDNVAKIPRDEQLNNWKPLEEQITYDPEFWENYATVNPGFLKE